MKAVALSIVAVLALSCGDSASLPRGENERPTASLSGPGEVDVGVEVLLDASGSVDEDGTIEEYRFDPGDGTGTIITSDDYLLWTYDRPDVYTVTLTVVDNRGGKDSVAATVIVGP
jgi:chitodextrinase